MGIPRTWHAEVQIATTVCVCVRLESVGDNGAKRDGGGNGGRWCVVTDGRGFAARHLPKMLLYSDEWRVHVVDLVHTITLDRDEEPGVRNVAAVCGSMGRAVWRAGGGTSCFPLHLPLQLLETSQKMAPCNHRTRKAISICLSDLPLCCWSQPKCDKIFDLLMLGKI
jgi:hypothetical protein